VGSPSLVSARRSSTNCLSDGQRRGTFGCFVSGRTGELVAPDRYSGRDRWSPYAQIRRGISSGVLQVSSAVYYYQVHYRQDD
jgi:hypothetical protein